MAESSAGPLVVSGATGKMGASVARLVSASDEWTLAGGIAPDAGEDPAPFPDIVAPAAAGDLLGRAAAVIDFSAPELLRTLLETHGDALAGTPLVVGTTGLTEAEHRLLDAQAERSPVLVAANFSVGVNVLLALAEQAAAALGVDYDIEIVEAHHRRKVDAPSGTALALGEAVARGRNVDLGTVRRDGRSGNVGARPEGEIGFHAVRGGDVVGEHQLLFLGDLETVELAHRASDRSLFAAGALRAASWLLDRRPGRYTMKDVLGLA